jgi:hypothetical protein
MVELLPEGTDVKKLKSIRTRRWYKRFHDLVAIVRLGNPEATMKAIYKMMDTSQGFGHANTAYYAEESLELVLKEEGLWHAD